MSRSWRRQEAGLAGISSVGSGAGAPQRLHHRPVPLIMPTSALSSRCVNSLLVSAPAASSDRTTALRPRLRPSVACCH